MSANSSEPIVVFHHIPKTAGSTLFNAFQQVYKPEEIYMAHGVGKSSAQMRDEVSKMSPAQRSAIRLIYGHQVWYGVHELFEAPCQYITFVRHPIVRYISWYYHARRTPQNEFTKIFQQYSLEEIVAKGEHVYPNHLTVYFSRKNVDRHNMPDCAKVTTSTLQCAMHNARQYHFVGLQEAFTSEVARMNKLLPRKIQLEQSQRVASERDAENFSNVSVETLQALTEQNWADNALYAWILLTNRKNIGPVSNLPAAKPATA